MGIHASAFDRLTFGYDGAAWLYSGGAIAACRRWGGGRARLGERVLVAGGGTGIEAVAAARAGARVTAVDAAATMCRRARRRLRRAGVADRVCVLQEDVLTHTGGPYDVVVAQFFLNVFGPARLPAVLNVLRGLLAPGGRLIVGDFAGGAGRARRCYHDLPMHLFARLGANDVHRAHDLAASLAAAGFRPVDGRRFRLFGCGPGWIEGHVAVQAPT